MKLEDQVCSLELSKKLFELGVKQESLFCWRCIEEESVFITWNGKFTIGDSYSAFTASELLESLPIWSDISKRDENDYMCRVFEKDTDINHNSFDDNPCDALAKMLIHLIENKIIEIN